MIGIKTCSQCKDTKSLSEFYSHRTTKDRKESICKPCRAKMMRVYRATTIGRVNSKKSRLKQRYGMALDDYERLVAATKNTCQLCRRSFDDIKPVVDHCHGTGKVRAVLCVNCNSVLGLVHENKETLTRMVGYLGEHNGLE